MAATGHYHCEAKAVSRADGRSAVAAAAYRAAERIHDQRTGQTHDYRAKGGVLHSEIIVPAGSPAWAKGRAALWNAAEAAEDKSTRRDIAKTGRDFIIGLPHEISAAGRIAVAREFARYLCDTYGMAVDFSVHDPDEAGDQRNYHAHVLTSTRVMTDAGFGGKLRELDSKVTSGKHLEAIREKLADIQNAAYAREGIDVRVDHRSYQARGMDNEATVHLGPGASSMERKGIQTDLGDRNRAAKAGNENRANLRAEIETLTLEIRDEATARAERQAERQERAAVRTFEPAKILAAITERRSTFSRADLNRLLKGEIADKAEREDVTTRILASHEVIGLHEDSGKPVSRYTTRTVLAAEMAIMQDARALDGMTRHGLTDWQKADALDRHAHLDREQRAAFDRATGPGGFTMIAGEAGTGKSTATGAIRDAYEAAGFTVKGLAWTNAVVQDMRADGFTDASTIASELGRVEKGSSVWNSRTVLMVDEAAMLSSKHLAEVMTKAKATGAKVILTGDAAQLGSIERGGMFGALEQEHGAAELHTVRRITDAEERRAWNQMHEGNFRPALDLYDRKGAINWAQTGDEARAALVAKYAADTAATPDKNRFVFANSNAEVAALNKDIRGLYRDRGQLGDDHQLRGTDGPADYATGDRIMFTASAQTKEARAAGFILGATGTIQKIDGQRVTLALDGERGGKARVVAFTVGENADRGEFNSFRHGYAGTIYKGQGRTLDQTYVLHSASMGAASSYVGLSRHRESVSIFTTRGADAWMMATGGAENLTEAQRKSAERSYARWGEAKPELAARHGFADYVAYVQEQQRNRPADHSADLARLARQMGRVDDRRSASQFHYDPKAEKDTGSFAGAATRATGTPQEGREGSGLADGAASRQGVPTGQQSAAAHRTGARIAAIRNPFRQAQALHRAHVRDADQLRRERLAGKKAAEQAAAVRAAQQAEARRQSQLEREQMARDVAARKAVKPATVTPDTKAAATEATKPAPKQQDATIQNAVRKAAEESTKAAGPVLSRAEQARADAAALAKDEHASGRHRFRERGRTR